MPRVLEIRSVFCVTLVYRVRIWFSSSGGRKFQNQTLPREGPASGWSATSRFSICGIHAPVHPADALHKAHRIPVDVVVDHPRGVLEVETLGENIGGDQDADLLSTLLGELRRGEAVIVGCEALNYV